jgi:hypothetical protein
MKGFTMNKVFAVFVLAIAIIVGMPEYIEEDCCQGPGCPTCDPMIPDPPEDPPEPEGPPSPRPEGKSGFAIDLFWWLRK